MSDLIKYYVFIDGDEDEPEPVYLKEDVDEVLDALNRRVKELEQELEHCEDNDGWVNRDIDAVLISHAYKQTLGKYGVERMHIDHTGSWILCLNSEGREIKRIAISDAAEIRWEDRNVN